MSRKSSNFQVTELLNTSSVSDLQLDSNDFGSFIYKDHVTRKAYDVQQLKMMTSTVFSKQVLPSIHKHKYNKSTECISKIEQRFKGKNEQMELKKHELTHFLEQLVMMSRIKQKRNHIVSGTQKAEQRKSMLPSIMELLNSRQKKQHSIDLLKQKVRKQVNSLNNELFRQYISNQQPYRPVFNQLNIASTQGALNTSKIRQIKHKIKQCTQLQNQTHMNAFSIIKKQQLDAKQNQIYDQYFASVSSQIDQEIHLKMRHQASYNWKYGKKSTFEDLFNTYKLQNKFKLKNQ